jgi:hypothetical protein
MRIRSVLIASSLVGLLALAACDAGMSRDSGAKPGETQAVAAEDLVFCQEVGERLTRDDCDDARAVATRVKAGVGAFNAPETMMRGKPVTIALAIGEKAEPPPRAEATPSTAAPTEGAQPDPDPDIDKGTEGPPPPPPPPETPDPAEAVAGNEGVVVQYAPVIGRRMAADLIGEGFDIKPLADRVQTVSPHGLTTWQWSVTAKEGGRHTLTIKSAVVVKTSLGRELSLVSTTRSKAVEVRVSPLAYAWDVIQRAPTWLKGIAAVLVGLGGVFAAWRGMIAAARGKGGEDKKDEPDEKGGGEGDKP